MKKFKSLNVKLTTTIVLLSILISAVSCFVGYLQYQDTIRKLYNHNGYVVGEIISDQLDHDHIAQYAKTWQKDEYYDEMETYLKNVETASNAAYIYIVVPNEDQTMTYIYDSSGLSLGDKDPISSHFDDVYGVYQTGERADDYFVRKSAKYGYLTSSILPVKDSSGQVVALLFVDIFMALIVSTLTVYVLRAVLISVVVLAIFCVIAWIYMRRTVLMPLKIIGDNAHSFAENGAQVTEELKEIQTGDELQVMAESITTMEHSIVQYIANIQKVTAEKERIGAELDVATQIQADMLPSIFPAFPERNEFDVYATMTPAKEVGGDFYDFFLIDDDHLALVMADVSGKGVPAALFMMISKTLIKTAAQNGLSPRAVLEKVNNQLCENNDAGMFVTVWLGILEVSTGKMICANAGHEYPAIMRKDGEFELFKDKHGFVLAGMEGSRYREYEIDLNVGDRLFVYTDGVPEATDAHDELYGTDRMIAALNKAKDGTCKELLISVHKDIDAFEGEEDQFDDITMLCLEIKAQSREMKKLSMEPSLEKIPDAVAFFEDYLSEAEVPMKVIMQINVVVDEVFSNIARYSGATSAILGCSVVDGKVTIRFADNGSPYDPTTKADPDITLSAEEREIGGLGIFMVKKMMDAVNYSYTDGQNILTLEKQL